MNSGFFRTALNIGRPPNIKKLFPNSKALIISGKYINRIMINKGSSICVAVNARNIFIIKGALKAAQRANSVIILEIAKSEGGINGYCAVNFWNLARIVDSLCNELKITIPVVIHADHYTIKSKEDILTGILEIPTLFEAGITSIALDASHLDDVKNLLSTIKLNKFIPKWSGLETEIGEIKGGLGLSTPDEANFMIRGLNAHNIFPDWIAINNGTIHGIESSGKGIRLLLTSKIHNLLSPYKVCGAQHGTSGNTTSKLKELALKTHTTKANIATSLQMISWGVKVNKYGNAELNNKNQLVKCKGRGVSSKTWSIITQHARNLKLTSNNYKKLNLKIDNILISQPKKFRERMSKNVEDFIYNIIVNIFNAENTADIAIEKIIKHDYCCPISNVIRSEDPNDWSYNKIIYKASKLNKNKSPKGNFDD